MHVIQGLFSEQPPFHGTIGEANCRWGLLLLEPSLWTAVISRCLSHVVTGTHQHVALTITSINNDHLLHKSHGQNYNLTAKWPGCTHMSSMFASRSSAPSLILEVCQGQGQSVFSPLPLPHH